MLKGKSFNQIIESLTKEYYSADTLDKKIDIIEKRRFIIEPQVSKNLLNLIKDSINEDKYNRILFKKYYDILKFSLSKEDNLNFYRIAQINKNDFDTESNDYDESEDNFNETQNKSEEFLALNEPINHFSLIIGKIISFSNKNLKKGDFVKEIQNFIEELKIVFWLNFKNEIFHPHENYPNYSYNYLCWRIVEIIHNFEKKRKEKKKSENDNKKLFFINNDNGSDDNEEFEDYLNDNEKEEHYNRLVLFLEEFQNIVKNLSLTSTKLNLKIIKIMIFYFEYFESNRNSNEIFKYISSFIHSLESKEINPDITSNYYIYSNDNNNILYTKENWVNIKPNDYVKIKTDEEKYYIVKIKNFNNHVLDKIYNKSKLFINLDLKKIEHLNIYGLMNYNFIKFDSKIEEESKNILKSILRSDLYITSFLKYDQRFNEINEKKNIFISLLKGENKDAIFDEIWDNIIFIPFPPGICGYSLRDCYSIFISNNYYSNSETNPFQIIPKIQLSINTIMHEITHILALILYANIVYIFGIDSIGTNNYETICCDNPELEEIQNLFFERYKSNMVTYKKEFKDFGEVIETNFYGIILSEYHLYSGLFFLTKESYQLNDIKLFRKKFYDLFIEKIIFQRDEINKINNINLPSNLIEASHLNNNKKLILYLLGNNVFLIRLLEIFPHFDNLSNFAYYDYNKSKSSDKNIRLLNYSFVFKRDKKDKS